MGNFLDAIRACLAGVVLALVLASSAHAQQSECFDLTSTVERLEAEQIEHIVLSEAERARFLEQLTLAIDMKFQVQADLSAVTDVLLAVINDQLMFGVVQHGCLSPPEPLASYLPEPQRSGYTPTGIFAAHRTGAAVG